MTLGERQEWACFYCECPLTPATLTMDHIIPRSRGGDNGLDNMVGACFPCNNQRGDMNAGAFLALKRKSNLTSKPTSQPAVASGVEVFALDCSREETT